MRIAYVSAFFPLPTAKHSIDTYRAQFAKLVALEVPMVLFLDPALNWTFPSHVRVVPLSLQDTWPMKSIPDAAQLPPYRSPADTLEYMRVQLAKTEFLVRATDLVPESDWFAWVDFGLPHVFRRPEETLSRLRDLHVPDVPCIRTAGIWTCAPLPLMDGICWRFAGGFVLVHRSKTRLFDTAVQASVQRHLPRIAWEVNLWADVERHGVDLGWFPANHDDSIIPFTEQL